MKRKIALLLALAMILSLIPANLFAQQNVTPIRRTPTTDATEAAGSFIYTIRVPAQSLQNALLNNSTAHDARWGVVLRASLEGASADYIRFPVHSGFTVDYHVDNPAVRATDNPFWPLTLDGSSVSGVFSPIGAPLSNMAAPVWAERGFSGRFYRDNLNRQQGDIALLVNMEHAAWLEALAPEPDNAYIPHLRNLLDRMSEFVAWEALGRARFAEVEALIPDAVAAADAYIAGRPDAGLQADWHAARQNLINAMTRLQTHLNARPAQILAANGVVANATAPNFVLPATHANHLPATEALFAAYNATMQNIIDAHQDVLDAMNMPAATAPVGVHPLFGSFPWTPSAFNPPAGAALEVAWSAAINTLVTVTMPALGDSAGTAGSEIADALVLFNTGGAQRNAAQLALNGLAPPPTITDLPLISSWNRIPAGGVGGYIDIQVPIQRVRHADAELVLRVGGTVVARGRLLDPLAAGVTVIGGEIRPFEDEVSLDRIIIRENQPGALTDHLLVQENRNAFAVRFVAPPGYTWERREGATFAPAATAPQNRTWFDNTRNEGRVRQLHRNFLPEGPQGFLYTDPGPFPSAPFITSPHNVVRWHCTVDGIITRPDGRQELLVIFDGLARNPQWAAEGLAELHFENLRLAAGPNAPAEQDPVEIDVLVGIVCAYTYGGWYWGHNNPDAANVPGTPPPAPPTGPIATPAPGGTWVRPPVPTPAPGQAPDVPVHPACFHFGNPGRFPISQAEITRTTVPAGETGLALGWNARPGGSVYGTWSVRGSRNGVPVARRLTAGLSLDVYTGSGWATTVRSGSLDGAYARNGVNRSQRTLELRVIENVPRALAMGTRTPVTFTFPEGIEVVGVSYYVTQGSLATRGSQVTRNTTQNPISTTQFLAPNVVQITDTLAPSNSTRQLRVRFDIAVRAGFAGMHDVEDIYVEVSGSGVNLLPTEDNTVAVLGVFDPITVTFPDPIQVDTVGLVHNLTERTPIGDIVIQETAPGRLQVGQEIEIFVARSYLHRPHDITMIPGPLLVDTAESGLNVSAMRAFTDNRNGIEVIGVAMTVTAASRAGTDGGTITLSANDIFGRIYPGENYWIVVGGNAVANNHAWTAGRHTQSTTTPVRPVSGIFAEMPYYGTLVERIGFDYAGHRANSIAGRTFSPQTQVEGAPEMIWHRAPGMTFEGGFVGLRAFANIAGVDPETGINWVSTSRVANIEGWDWQGNWVTITMTQGSPWAQITRGTTRGASDILVARVDIAEFSDGRTGPSGTVVPVFQNNRIYVPFRFVFNAFGYSADYDIARDGQVVRVVALP